MGTAFSRVICLDTGADKDEALARLAQKYKGCYWVEDKPENLVAGSKAGFQGILMEHGHNMNAEHDGIVVKNWEEIYNILTNQVVTPAYTR